MSEIIESSNGDEAIGISLPVPKKHLGEFISNLLGQRQSIEKSYTIPFEAKYEYFIHLISLIEQRLEQQNNYEIVSFQSKIGYDNNMFRTYESIETFKNLSESFDVVSTSVRFKFSILVLFPKKQTPEKQEIYINFFTNAKDKDTKGLIELEIYHTERTWGDDMLILIESSFNHIWYKEKAFKKFLKKSKLENINVNLFIVFSLLIGYFSYLIHSSSSKHSEAKTLKFENYQSLVEQSSSNLADLHKKLDFFISEVLQPTASSSPSIASFLGIVITFIFLIILVNLLIQEYIRTEKSYLLLTEKSQRDMEENKKEDKLSFKIVSVISAVILGLFVNFLYDLIK